MALVGVVASLTLASAALGGTKAFTGTVIAGSGASAVSNTSFTVSSSGPISATVSWTPTSAALTVALVDPSGTLLPVTTTGSNPITVTGQASAPGSYTVRVKAKSGTSTFTGTVTFPGPSVPTYVSQIGGGTAGHAGMYPSGLDVGPDGTVYVADTGNDQVAAYAADGSQLWRIGARGTKAVGKFNNPRDVAYLNGRLYVDDSADNRVEVIDTTANPVTSASVTAWTTKFPSTLGISAGVDVHQQNIILVSEDTSNQIGVFLPDGTHVCDVAVPTPTGGKPPLPRDAAANATALYVAAYQNDQVDVFPPIDLSASSPCPTRMSGVVGSSGQSVGQFKRPYGVDLGGGGQLFVADSDNERIQEFSSSGTPIAVYGSASNFSQLRRVAVANGQVYGADLWGYHVDRFPACTTICLNPATPAQTYPNPIQGPQLGQFNEPSGLTFDPTSQTLTIADSVNQRMQQFTPSAGFGTWTYANFFGQRGWGASDQSGFNWPRDVVYDTQTSTIWVADTKNNRLLPFTPSGTPLYGQAINLNPKGIPSRLYWPYGIDAVAGNLAVSDTFTNQVESRNATTGAQTWIASTVDGVGLKNPYDVAHNGTVLFIADAANHRIVELNSDNTDPSVALGTSCLHSPQGVAYDPVSGMLWASDTSYNRIVEIDPSTGRCLQTLNRFGVANGDSFNHPTHLDVVQDATGHAYLLVCDVYNDRITVFDLHEN